MTERRVTPGVPTRLVVVLVTGGIMPIVDTTIVAIGLRDIGVALGADVAELQWVSTAYLLALAVVLPVVGWLQSFLGGRATWIVGSVVFLASSLLCAVAGDIGQLIAFRVMQGVGSGILFPLMQTLPMQHTERSARARTMAIMSVPIALGPILGPVVGGIVLSTLGWRWLFAINLPLGLIALVLALAWLRPTDGPVVRRPLDVIGLLLVAPGVGGLLLALSNLSAGEGVGALDVWAPGLGGAILVAAFAVWSLRRTHPLVDLRLLGVPTVRAATIAMVFLGANLYAATFVLPLALQTVGGLTALTTAAFLIVQGVGSFVARMAAGRLVERCGSRGVAVAGFAVIAAMTVPFVLRDGSTPLWMLGIALFVRGLGLGVVLVPVMTAGYLDIEPTRMPDASAFSRMAQQLGGAFGIATIAIVLSQITSASGATAGFRAAFAGVVVICLAAAAGSVLLPGRADSTR
ncbi:MAG: drug resistance transporter, EmrB/QacA subfamily [Microbacterium sp.]|jgi:EmrB/QacA subfamily drug resistance transporter|nr:drug resistance transporter, EmrB/QacA subfamily [Microbacterium sp.]